MKPTARLRARADYWNSKRDNDTLFDVLLVAISALLISNIMRKP
jgi:hypothetical protein